MTAILRLAFALGIALLPGMAGAQADTTPRGELLGRVINGASGTGIADASIRVHVKDDSTSGTDALVKPDGSFRVTGLAAASYVVRIRALGYSAVTLGVIISRDEPTSILGDITLSPIVATLSAQDVRATRDEVELTPDRNSYAVKNMTAAAGGTAIDVLRNVPSVEVDGENKVSLRGNENITVQINGRPSSLKGEQLGAFLAQLPASTVARVEVATNPSAKNDPEGAGGILNIVLTQQTEQGVSGGLSSSTGTTGSANITGNIGSQSGPWTFFSSVGVARDARGLDGHSNRMNTGTPDLAFVESQIGGSQQLDSQSLTIRSEYKLAEHDALSFDVVGSTAQFARLNTTSYSDLDASRAVIGLFNQFSNQSAHTLSQDYAFAYHRTGAADASTLSTEGRYTEYHYTLDNILSTMLVQPDGSTGTTAGPPERDRTILHTPTWTLQSDFAHPFASHFKLETGLKGVRRAMANDFSAASRDSSTGAYSPVAARANVFDYTEDIGAAYVVGTQPVGHVTAQGGLRVEQASNRLELSAAQTSVNRYASLFPSALLSYDLTDTRQVKASYSRRITRPDPFQLNPIGYRDDARNVFQGNPELRPEYTNAFELGIQETRAWGSIQVSPYLRQTAHAVRYIRTVDATGVTFSTFANVASARTLGSDVNVNVKRDALTLSGGGSAYHYDSDAGNLPGNPSAHTLVWSTRANVTWAFTPALDAQFSGFYRAPVAVEGGAITAYVMTNFTLREKLWGDKGSITLRVSDPFRMLSFGRTTADEFSTEFSERRFGLRGVFLTFTRNFGEALKLAPKVQDDGTAPAPTSP